MIKFVIVEDEEHYKELFAKIIDKIMFGNSENYEVVCFDCYNKKLQNQIDDLSIRVIYIMDIELKGSKSGLDIAKIIRENDWDSEIIFVTSHDKMFETIYRALLKVFDFIEKFHDMEPRLEDDLNKIVSQKYDIKKFFYNNGRIELQIYLKDILYFYRDTVDRKTVIVTNKNLFQLNMPLSEIIPKVDKRFRRVHRACLVNNDMVNKYDWINGNFILKNGKKVNLCSKKFKGDKYV